MTTLSVSPQPASTPEPTLDAFCFSEAERELANKWGITCTGFRLSPNRQWAVMEGYAGIVNGKNLPYIRILSIDGSKEWVFDFSHFGKEIPLCGWLVSQYWSPDGRYLYISPGVCSRPAIFGFGESPALYRVELSTGQLSEVLPITGNLSERAPYDEQDFYDFDFSPDGTQLAYLQSFNLPVVVTVRDFLTAEETHFTLGEKYSVAGCLKWLPDGRRLAFFAATATRLGERTTASFYVIDTDKSTLQEVIRDRPYLYCPLRADDPRAEGVNSVYVWRVYPELIKAPDWVYNYTNVQDGMLDMITGEFVLLPTITPWPTRTP